ncbi:AraC family transcriptional regulator [Chryseobacterium culicis]|uniref:helix-turn-helix domain-containing protein n=2 Tax=Chryseobacterium TaxID=59732 RepID=UPI00258F40E4|nr:AraC family transcriptional regulator [Chryseobacterium culicis]
MQISPPNHLAPFIRHYIFLENSGENIMSLRLFTDGSCGLILSGDMKLYSGTAKERMPLSFFYGMVSSYKDFFSKEKFSLIAVVFQPYFLHILSGISAKALSNKTIPVEDILTNKLEIFQEKLFNKTAPLSIINGLNTFFTQFLSGGVGTDHHLISAAQQYLLLNKGSVSSKDLQHFTGYSERQLERKFEYHMGMSPKKYANIIRMHYFLSLINNRVDDKNMTMLSYQAGYSDQSHLIRDFKNTTGLTPKQYLNKENKMAVNFIEL